MWQISDGISRKTLVVVTNHATIAVTASHRVSLHPRLSPLWLRNCSPSVCAVSGCFPHPTRPLLNAEAAKRRWSFCILYENRGLFIACNWLLYPSTNNHIQGFHTIWKCQKKHKICYRHFLSVHEYRRKQNWMEKIFAFQYFMSRSVIYSSFHPTLSVHSCIPLLIFFHSLRGLFQVAYLNPGLWKYLSQSMVDFHIYPSKIVWERTNRHGI